MTRVLTTILVSLMMVTVGCESEQAEDKTGDPADKTPGIDPDTYCERGWEQVRLVVSELREDQRPEDGLPERDEYLETCGQLPVDVQRCTMTDYATEHPDECDDAFAGLTEEQRALVDALNEKGADES